jgi:membrane protease YdiL (CAAX protease family)
MSKRAPTRVRGPKSGASYWEASRAHRYSLLFALPLLLLYEFLAAVLTRDPTGGSGVRNGADVLLKDLFFAVLGARGPLLFMAVVVAVSVALVWRDLRAHRWHLRAWIFGGMIVESLLLALALGVVVGTLTARLLGPLGALAVPGTDIAQAGWPTQLMLSVGAGLYEELLFRVVLVSALANGGRLALGWTRGTAGVVATILGALIFSAFHYVGPYGDDWALESFTFRAIAGLMFSALYLTRGFGITAWTHATYDVMVMTVWGE